MERVPLGIEQLDILIRIDAFRSLNKDKRALLWEAHYKENNIPKNENQQQFFKVRMSDFTLPKFKVSQIEMAYDQLELLGFSLYAPFVLLENPPENSLLVTDFNLYLGKEVTIYGYLVTVKNTGTSRGDRMFFGTFLDQAGNWLDTVHFPPVAKKYPFQGKGIYEITGKVVEEFDFLTLEATRLKRMPYVNIHHQSSKGSETLL